MLAMPEICMPRFTPIATLVTPAICIPLIGVVVALVRPANCSPLALLAMFDTPESCTPRISPSMPLMNPAACTPYILPRVNADRVPMFTPFASCRATLVSRLSCTPWRVSTLPKMPRLKWLVSSESSLLWLAPKAMLPKRLVCAASPRANDAKRHKTTIFLINRIPLLCFWRQKYEKKWRNNTFFIQNI